MLNEQGQLLLHNQFIHHHEPALPLPHPLPHCPSSSLLPTAHNARPSSLQSFTNTSLRPESLNNTCVSIQSFIYTFVLRAFSRTAQDGRAVPASVPEASLVLTSPAYEPGQQVPGTGHRRPECGQREVQPCQCGQPLLPQPREGTTGERREGREGSKPP